MWQIKGWRFVLTTRLISIQHEFIKMYKNHSKGATNVYLVTSQQRPMRQSACQQILQLFMVQLRFNSDILVSMGQYKKDGTTV